MSVHVRNGACLFEGTSEACLLLGMGLGLVCSGWGLSFSRDGDLSVRDGVCLLLGMGLVF